MKKQTGAGAIEYIVGLAFLAMVMLTPFAGGKNVSQMLIDGLKSHHAGYMYAQSRSHLQIGVDDVKDILASGTGDKKNLPIADNDKNNVPIGIEDKSKQPNGNEGF